MGLGKTAATLTAIQDLFQQCMITRVLVIAPLRVAAHVWPAELKKWNIQLSMSVAVGDADTRKRAVFARTQVCVINRENTFWLVDLLRKDWCFDMVVIDESSSFKAAASKRFRSLKRVRSMIDRVVLLTGTPASNSLLDLWPQVYLMDTGERLGKTYTGYRSTFFEADYSGFKWELRPGAEKRIHESVADLFISMRTEDYLELPDRMEITTDVVMDTETLLKYNEMEERMLLEFGDTEITAISAGVLCGKLQQLAQGAVYDGDRCVHHLHDFKLDALEELLEAAQNDNVMVAYTYQHDVARIKKRFPHAVDVKEKDAIACWNKGKIRLLMAHPASAGHGLNLQDGGHRIIWFGLTWSLELRDQLNARLHRQGQGHPVTIHTLMMRDTIDEDIMAAVKGKAVGQDRLIDAVKSRLAKK